MTTNPYINNFSATNEQGLLENLVIESIQMYGLESYYLPRELKNFDPVYESDAVSEYNSNYPIEMYIKDQMGFQGDGTFLAKFGLEVRDQITLTVSIRRFDEELGLVRNRPQEGDLIYFPLGNRILQVMFVNHRSVFYQLGSLRVYDLVCESFEYSSERFNTGIPFVDGLEADYSQDTNVTGPTNFENPYDSSADNVEIETEANTWIDFTETNPFGDL